jgi:dimethylglycine dehydrogenase
MRQEGGGMLIGTYEQRGPALVGARDAVGFRAEPAAQRSRAHRAEPGDRFEHFPALGKRGIRKVVNGPFTFAPDGNPLIGPVAA